MTSADVTQLAADNICVCDVQVDAIKNMTSQIQRRCAKNKVLVQHQLDLLSESITSSPALAPPSDCLVIVCYSHAVTYLISLDVVLCLFTLLIDS